MAYAKKCKYCNTVQVVWNDKLEGPNKFMEVETNLQHSRDRCDAAKNSPAPVQQETFSPPKQSPPIQTQQAPPIDDFKLAQLITKVDNLNIGIAKVMSMIQTLNDLSMNAEDISRLRTENAELKDILKNREDNFVPANQVQSDWVPEEDSNPQPGQELTTMDKQHVQNMVKKGQEDEELEI